MSKYQDALNNVKIAPSFMGGNDEYRRHLDSSVPFLKDIATLQELIDKETKYQALEDRLGIDLLTLFKALENGVYIEGTKVYGEDLKYRYFIGTPSLEYEHHYQKIPMVTRVRTEDFNKTWWLRKTKECEE